MTHFEAYLLTRLDSIGALLTGLIVFSFFAISASILVYAFIGDKYDYNEERDEPKRKKLLNYIKKVYIPAAIIASILISIVPTTKEMAFIYIAPAIVNNQDMQETAKKLPNISKLGLEYIEEILKDEIKEKAGAKSND